LKLHLIAIWGAFAQQWKVLSPDWNWIMGMLANVPLVAVFAWIATQSGRSSVVGYLAIGVFLMTLWNQCQVGIRWSVYGEAFQGTIEFSLISRAPLGVFLLGKALAQAAAAARPALAALVVALVVSRQMPSVADPLGLAVAACVAVIGVVATAFAFAPLSVLAARQLDPIVALRPFVIVFSGFLYPVSSLPVGLEGFARVFPTAWAMDAVLISLEGGGRESPLFSTAVAVGLAAIYFVLTFVMFRLVESRVRVSGALIT
jgi:ABC-type multidrug transport system permease subunit